MHVDLIAKAVEQLPGVVVGLVGGAFIPSILRKVHAELVKLGTDVKTEAEKIEKKL